MELRLFSSFAAAVICFCSMTVGAMVAPVTLVVMAHAHRWESLGGEITGTALFVGGVTMVVIPVVYAINRWGDDEV